MSRGTTRLVVPLVLAALACVSTQAQQPQPFKAGTNLVVVPVVVVDGKGATVAGLTPNDFRVTEDGRPVAIEMFTAPVPDASLAEQSRFIVIALDNLAVPDELAYRVKNIANGFVDRLGPNDVMSVIVLSGGKAVTTNSRADLKSAISRFGISAAAEAMPYGQRAEHGLRMINALSEQVAKAPHPRKVMVFIGNAHTFSPTQQSAFASLRGGSGPNGFDISPEWEEAVRATTRNNVSVYVIDPRGMNGPAGDWSKSFAAETGGYAWGRFNNFNAATEQVFRESASYYLIGYTPPVTDNRIHTIDVKVERSGVTVRARKARR